MAWRVVVFYLLTWLSTFVVGAVQEAVRLPDELLFLFQLAPGAAGVLTMRAFRRQDGVRITFFSRQMPLRRYAWAFLLPLSFGLLAYGFAVVFLGRPESLQVTPLLLASMIIGAVGEEIGWRGYLHKRIAPHMNGLTSSLVVGLLWALFHVQYYAGGVLFVASMALAFVSLSVMAYGVLADYGFNVLGATLFHLGINLSAVLVAGLVASYSLPFAVAYGVIAALVAVGVVYVRREWFFAPLAPTESE